MLTQYAQQVIGYDPLEFGLMSAVVPAMAMIGSIASQRAVSKTGLRPVAAISLTLMAVGCGLLTQLSPHGDFVRDMLPGTLLLGLGLGAGTVAASIASITGIDENDAGVASGINNMAFAIGGALGVAGLTSISLAWNDHVLGRPGMSAALARTEGFRWAFAVATAIAVLGAIAALTLIGGKSSPEGRSPEGRSRKAATRKAARKAAARKAARKGAIDAFPLNADRGGRPARCRMSAPVGCYLRATCASCGYGRLQD